MIGDGAKQSGGRRVEVSATISVSKGLQQLAGDLSAQYMLQYVLPEGVKLDRRLNVSIKRRGVSLRAPSLIPDRLRRCLNGLVSENAPRRDDVPAVRHLGRVVRHPQHVPDEHAEFSGTEAGAVFGTTALASLVAPFFVGLVADRWFATERVLASLYALGGVFLLLATQVTTFAAVYVVLLAFCLCYFPTIALTNSITMQQVADPGAISR